MTDKDKLSNAIIEEWIAGDGLSFIHDADVGRFDPVTEEFTSCPLPTRVSYLRDIVFTEDGEICSSHSNLPAYAIEGGLAGFICLDPGD